MSPVSWIYLYLLIFFRERDTRDASSSLTNAFVSVRELQLHLGFFNLVYADVLWGYKVNCLWLTILSGFSSIRLVRSNPVMGGIYFYTGMATIIAFIGMFQFAYQVEAKMGDMRKMMEFMSAGLVNAEERKYWSRVLRSIPRMGMNVGGFYCTFLESFNNYYMLVNIMAC